MNGYCGKFLRVDLSKGSLTDIPLSPSVLRDYVGGSGLAAHLFLEEILEAARAAGRMPTGGGVASDAGYPDPLGPDNPFIIATGPLTGTRLPATSRWTVSARSPLTGLWGEANVGGFFGAELKFAGYDGVLVTGRAAKPVYLLIDRGRASLEPADDIWGRDTYDVADLLAARHGGGGAEADGDGASAAPAQAAGTAKLRRPRVFTIGPAGENLVRYAAIVHDKHHVAGRTGMGAVMGAKNLKAVVARGAMGQAGQAGPEGGFTLADPAAVKELATGFVTRAHENMVTKSLHEAGTIMGMDLGGLIGDVPIRNWSLGAWGDELEKVGVGGYGAVLVGTSTCFACPIACKRKVTAEALGRKLEDAPGAEYETLGCLGPNLLISDLPALLVAGEVCNRLGLDTITAGGTLAYAYEAAEKGLLDGLVGAGAAAELAKGWGDAPFLVRMLGDIAHRRGPAGDALTEGSARLARRIGRPEALEFLAVAKGLEPPAHDARAVHGMAVAYATSTRGACHMSSLMYGVEHMGARAPEVGIESDGLQQSSEGRGRFCKLVQDLGAVYGQSAALCQLGGSIYSANDLAAMLNAATGFDYSLEDIMECGERIWHAKRGIGNLYGSDGRDDILSPRLLEVLEDGGAAGSEPDLPGMLAEWAELRGLDERGYARREVLERLGLGRLAGLIGG